MSPSFDHDDANRALMGSNMQSQAVPVNKPELKQAREGRPYHAADDVPQNSVREAARPGPEHAASRLHRLAAGG
jgi:DNA-directed RNA polymerase beta subunit